MPEVFDEYSRHLVIKKRAKLSPRPLNFHFSKSHIGFFGLAFAAGLIFISGLMLFAGLALFSGPPSMVRS